MLLLNKPLGLTPFQAISALKQQYPQYANSTISPAGRLDPMADGLLLLLVDQQNKHQSEFIKLDKTYHTTILFGLSTDSYDLLGLPQSHQPNIDKQHILKNLDQALAAHTGIISQSYPPFSAIQVNSRPLYYWAHRNQLDHLNIPKVDRNILALQKEDINQLSNIELLQYIQNVIPNINGNFRQQPIIQAWNDTLTIPSHYPTLQLSITCSSGTYIRSLAHSIGQYLKYPSLAMTITRTAIGPYSLDQAITLK